MTTDLAAALQALQQAVALVAAAVDGHERAVAALAAEQALSEQARLGAPLGAEPLPSMYSPESVAGWLGCDRSTVYAWIRRGELHAVTVGRHLRVSQTELLRWLADHPKADPAAPAAGASLQLVPARADSELSEQARLGAPSPAPVKLRRNRVKLGGVR